MTIAACYLSSEGVVFGADSTSTMTVRPPGSIPSGSPHHYNYAQKIFQIGTESTLGITMWGLGNLGTTSYRTLIACFADALVVSAPPTVAEVASRWNQFFWSAYATAYAQVLQRAQQLDHQAMRSPQEAVIAILRNSYLRGRL